VTEIDAVDALDFRLTAGVWDFARERAAEIAAHWEKRVAAQPRLFNGRVLVLGRYAIETRGRARVLAGAFIETDFAAFLAWREFGSPASNACNGFSMAALRGADGAFLLGQMAPHTATAGAIYFPAGTPDRQDLAGDVVDLDASARRELFEETGVSADEATIAPGCEVVFAPGRVACMKAMRLGLPADAAKARIDAWLAADAHAEFSRMHVVRGEADFDDRMPAFVRDYMAHVFRREAHQTLVT
jgi:8-oxo-dGTP pyrophosphatase MutT (NUDIX family)